MTVDYEILNKIAKNHGLRECFHLSSISKQLKNAMFKISGQKWIKIKQEHMQKYALFSISLDTDNEIVKQKLNEFLSTATIIHSDEAKDEIENIQKTHTNHVGLLQSAKKEIDRVINKKSNTEKDKFWDDH